MLATRLSDELTASIDNWDRQSHPMKKNQFGVFEITVPAKDGNVPIPHKSKIKVGIFFLFFDTRYHCI